MVDLIKFLLQRDGPPSASALGVPRRRQPARMPSVTDTQASQLSARAQQILKTLVEQYIRDGQPVGSRTLAKSQGMELSPATIRNVMGDLEELGLLASPHTSAGRVPTVQGYRIFVDSLLHIRPINEALIGEIRDGFSGDQDSKQMVRSATSFLSAFTHMAGVITVPKPEHTRLRQIEFLPLSNDRVLAILVVNDQEVQNRIIHTGRNFSARELEQAANWLNHHFAGRDLQNLRLHLQQELEQARAEMDHAMRLAVEMVKPVLEPADSEGASEDSLLVSGEANLLHFNELCDVQRLRELFDAFNQKRSIADLLERSLSADGIQIFIGQESGYSVFEQVSVVTAPYKSDHKTVGVLGVIGPQRMNYERVIPLVDVTSKLLSAALNNRS